MIQHAKDRVRHMLSFQRFEVYFSFFLIHFSFCRIIMQCRLLSGNSIAFWVNLFTILPSMSIHESVLTPSRGCDEVTQIYTASILCVTFSPAASMQHFHYH